LFVPARSTCSTAVRDRPARLCLAQNRQHPCHWSAACRLLGNIAASGHIKVRAVVATLSNYRPLRAGTASSSGAADRLYLFTTVLRGGYVTEGQCCSGIHFPCTWTAPTDAPQSSQVWTAHCSRFLFRVRTSCRSSLNRPSHGFTDEGIILLFNMFRCGKTGLFRKNYRKTKRVSKSLAKLS